MLKIIFGLFEWFHGFFNGEGRNSRDRKKEKLGASQTLIDEPSAVLTAD
jgi:hypothetical protein